MICTIDAFRSIFNTVYWLHYLSSLSHRAVVAVDRSQAETAANRLAKHRRGSRAGEAILRSKPPPCLGPRGSIDISTAIR